jgi:hypothetical protein
MRRLRLVVMTTLFFTVPGTAAAEEISVSELITNSEAMSGSEVTVEGELVGDYGFRDDGWMWTQLNGDAYAHSPIRGGGQPVGGNTGVGVRMPIGLGVGLDPPGGYGNRGPIVRLTGVWKHHDPARQGESYLEVTSMRIIEPGQAMNEEPQWIATWIGLGLLTGSLGLWRRSVG